MGGATESGANVGRSLDGRIALIGRDPRRLDGGEVPRVARRRRTRETDER